MKILAWLYGKMPATKHDTKRILMKVSELADAVTNIGAQLEKAKAEILAEIKNLQDALADADVPAAAEAAIAALKDKAQALDDINPDVAPPTT